MKAPCLLKLRCTAFSRIHLFPTLSFFSFTFCFSRFPPFSDVCSSSSPSPLHFFSSSSTFSCLRFLLFVRRRRRRRPRIVPKSKVASLPPSLGRRLLFYTSWLATEKGEERVIWAPHKGQKGSHKEIHTNCCVGRQDPSHKNTALWCENFLQSRRSSFFKKKYFSG